MIETDITTNGVRQRRGFGLIDGWEIIEKSPSNGRMVAIKLTLSEWLYNAVAAREVLTLNREYFRLDGGLERRLYELARKRCGQQVKWTVGMELLHRKSGSTDLLKRFRAAVKRIVLADSLPGYRLKYEPATDHVTFFSKDPKQSFDKFFRSLNLRSISDQSLGLLATDTQIFRRFFNYLQLPNHPLTRARDLNWDLTLLTPIQPAGSTGGSAPYGASNPPNPPYPHMERPPGKPRLQPTTARRRGRDCRFSHSRGIVSG